MARLWNGSEIQEVSFFGSCSACQFKHITLLPYVLWLSAFPGLAIIALGSNHPSMILGTRTHINRSIQWLLYSIFFSLKRHPWKLWTLKNVATVLYVTYYYCIFLSLVCSEFGGSPVILQILVPALRLWQHKSPEWRLAAPPVKAITYASCWVFTQPLLGNWQAWWIGEVAQAGRICQPQVLFCHLKYEDMVSIRQR